MNTSTIINMIRDDPTILDDVAGFVKRVNVKDQEQVVQEQVVIQQAVTVKVSIADRNGGECTIDDVKAAYALMVKVPLLEVVQQRADAATAAIQSADLTDPSALIKQLTAIQSAPVEVPTVPPIGG